MDSVVLVLKRMNMNKIHTRGLGILYGVEEIVHTPDIAHFDRK
jgi:hypothetical protein